MKIAQIFTYTYGDLEVEIEVRIISDLLLVVVDEIFGVKDASGEYIDQSDAELLVIKDAVNECLEDESDRGEWDEIIVDTRTDAAVEELEEVEPIWGHGPSVPLTPRVLH